MFVLDKTPHKHSSYLQDGAGIQVVRVFELQCREPQVLTKEILGPALYGSMNGNLENECKELSVLILNYLIF